MTIVRSGDREISHDELRAGAARIATALSELGVGHGDRAALMLRNEPAFLQVSAAIGLLGAVPLPINWHWRGDELRHVLTHSSARAVFVHADLVEAVEAVAPEGLEIVEVQVPEELAAVYGPGAPTGRHRTLDDLIAGHEPWAEPVQTPPTSLIYTSGTTGLPKGVLRKPVDPEAGQRMAVGVLEGMGLKAGMTTIVPAPLYHTAPNAQAVFALALGMEITLMPRFDGEEFLRLVAEHAITHAQTVPTMFVRMLALPEEVRTRYDVSSLQAVVHAAAPCPAHVKRRMIDWLGPIILEYYGGTEVGMVTNCDTEQWLAHPGTVGTPYGDGDIRIFDADGNQLGPDEPGEIYMRPPTFWPDFTYLDADDKRAEIERDGYVTLGDVGYLTADRFLFLSDRVRDMVISGGVNIYPAEIESCLLELEGVRDVAVFGVPDDQFGEALAAHVEVDPDAGLTEDALRDHVRTRLAGYKVPRTVVFDDDLPREDSGKIFKRRLRERYWESSGRSI